MAVTTRVSHRPDDEQPGDPAFPLCPLPEFFTVGRNMASSIVLLKHALNISGLSHQLVDLCPGLDPFPRPHTVPPGRMILAR